ncbi:hypothetical protein [Xenorhabdus bovienii]|uniref:hypothetical protein n=1 Tax=Xenorhabdus bovienii TaxID=40576 RepID=UPI0023B24AD1|nr:hypothetical protein [Xenorhabdus bovienii]MDE9537267.1 hypothetical protein [Xenorhabdus bovienii]MDE9590219.1 hypothetical protein [Xenorhabdus bovienii]
MSKDVIEKINTTLESAEEFKSEGASTIILDLDVYITILKRLAEYKNMEPVAYQYEAQNISGNWVTEMTTHYPDVEMFCIRNIFPLYRHPNK